MTTRQRSAKPVGKTAGERQRLPAELSQLAGGIDVGATSHFVAVPTDRAEPPVREFAASDLYRLAEWLARVWRPWSWSPPGCTGYRVLEERGFQDAGRASRTCRGARPTCGTASGCSSCTATACCREPSGLTGTYGLRSYLRQSGLVEYASQHMHKALTQMNVAPGHQRHHRQDRHGHH